MRKTLTRTCRAVEAVGGPLSLERMEGVLARVNAESFDIATGGASSEFRFLASGALEAAT